MKKLWSLLFFVSFLVIITTSYATANGAISITYEPVTMNFDLVDAGLFQMQGIDEVLFNFGLEYRNTDASYNSSKIDGAFAVSGFEGNGSPLYDFGLGNSWEMTATYVEIKDNLFNVTSDAFNYITPQSVGVLTFYVSTDMTQRANSETGLGYDDGTKVLQFAVYNPQPDPINSTSGGVVSLVSPFDGSRDMVMTVQYAKKDFLTSTNNPGAEVTAMNIDHNLDADADADGTPGNYPDPTAWKYETADPTLNYPYAFFTKDDGSFRFGTVPVPPGSCRMTGGGNDENGFVILGTPANSEDGRYTYGGQVGAPTGDQPQPYGEWTHHQFKGYGDKFVFRSGTASSSEESKILNIFCQDPCYCVNARPAPFKQISWDGIGEFRNISDIGIAQLEMSEPPAPKNPNKPVKFQAEADPICAGGIVPGKDGSKHYYRVHVNDIGEPGSGGLVSKGKGKKSTRSECDLDLSKFPELESDYTITEQQCADCPDTYQIEIHCTTDPVSPVIYSVGAFVEGGNLQIHPPVGMHMTPNDVCPE